MEFFTWPTRLIQVFIKRVAFLAFPYVTIGGQSSIYDNYNIITAHIEKYKQLMSIMQPHSSFTISLAHFIMNKHPYDEHALVSAWLIRCYNIISLLLSRHSPSWISEVLDPRCTGVVSYMCTWPCTWACVYIYLDPSCNKDCDLIGQEEVSISHRKPCTVYRFCYAPGMRLSLNHLGYKDIKIKMAAV